MHTDKSIFQSAGVKNVAKLLSANVIVQAIALIVYPILTRLYSPEDFGLQNLFLSIGGVLVLLSTAEYQNAIVLPKRDEDARALVHIGSIIAFVLTLITVLTIPFAHTIASIFKTPELSRWWWLMPLYIIIMSSWTLLNYYYTRTKQFTIISTYQIVNTLSNSGAKIGFGWSGFTLGGLIISSIIGPLLGLLTSVLSSWRSGISYLLRASTHTERIAVAREYDKFPKYSLSRSTINILSSYLPTFCLTPVFGTSPIGLWSMALTLAFVPINMFNRAVYPVLFQHASECVNTSRSMGGIYRKFTLWALGISIAGSVILFWILPWMVTLLLGDQWSETAEIIRWMLPWLICTVLTASTGALADVFGKQRIGLRFEITLALLRLASIILGIVLNDFMVAIIGYILSSALVSGAQYIWLMSLVKLYDRSLKNG